MTRKIFPVVQGTAHSWNGPSHTGISTAGGSLSQNLESPVKLVCHVPGDWHYVYGPQLPSVHSWKE